MITKALFKFRYFKITQNFCYDMELKERLKKYSNSAKQHSHLFEKRVQRVQSIQRMLGLESIAKESLLPSGGSIERHFTGNQRECFVRWPKRNRAGIASRY